METFKLPTRKRMIPQKSETDLLLEEIQKIRDTFYFNKKIILSKLKGARK